MKLKKSTKVNIGLAIGLTIVTALMIWFVLSGDNGELLKSLIQNDYSNEELRDKLNDFGFRGYVTIVFFSMLQVVFTFLPAEPVQVLAGLTFGFPIGLLCCAIGVLFGNSTIFLLHKLFGDNLREFFTKKMALDIHKLSKSSKIVAIVFILYFLPAIPYGMICFFAASTGMRYRRYLTVTMLGSLPSICIGVGLGYITIAYSWILSAVLLGLLVIVAVCLYRYREKLAKKLDDFAQDKDNLSRTTVQKINGFLLVTLYSALRVWLWLCGVTVRTVNKCEKELEKPSIVLCNHGAFMDFVYAESLLIQQRPHFVVARLYFYHKQLGWLLRKLGCFPKSMFARDIESTKNCLRVLQNGEILAMMPEARLSTAGRFEDIQESTYQFLQKSKVPVYTIRLQGDYLAGPKWGKGLRRGAVVEAVLEPLFTAEQVANLSLEDIKVAVEERLYFDEFQWLAERPTIRYRNKNLAEGLENILSLCPVCGEAHTIYTKGREVLCRNCGRLTSLDDRYGFTGDFRFAHLGEWYDWQTETLRKRIAEDTDFALQAEVTLRLPGHGKGLTRRGGEGVCTLDRGGLRYCGTKDGEEVDLYFPLKQVYRLLFGAGENFEIYDGTEILYFVPENKQSCVDWYQTSVILYDDLQQAKDKEGSLC